MISCLSWYYYSTINYLSFPLQSAAWEPWYHETCKGIEQLYSSHFSQEKFEVEATKVYLQRKIWRKELIHKLELRLFKILKIEVSFNIQFQWTHLRFFLYSRISYCSWVWFSSASFKADMVFLSVSSPYIKLNRHDFCIT